MTHAYTPGLIVTGSITLRKRRVLPVKGETTVPPNTFVKPQDVVARTFLPGEVLPLNVANLLNIPPEDVPAAMIKKEADPIKKGEIIAESRGLFGLFKSKVAATVDGTIETISGVTGQVLQRDTAIPVEVQAYIQGTIIEVIPNEGVVVETHGALVQGIFGIGPETFGPLKMACNNPAEILDPDKIYPEHQGAIIVGGSLVTAPALKKAVATGVHGVIVGGFDDKDLRSFLGYDLGVAITGSEQLGLTLVVTEGFGQMAMAQRTFELLRRCQGLEASLNGATQIRAGVIRPEVIIPMEKTPSADKKNTPPQNRGLSIGTPVRMIRQPYFGRLGKVVALPAELVALESGSRARILEIEFADGNRAVVPRANVELIEG